MLVHSLEIITVSLSFILPIVVLNLRIHIKFFFKELLEKMAYTSFTLHLQEPLLITTTHTLLLVSTTVSLVQKKIHNTVVSSSFKLWHQRLGHPNKDALAIVLNKCNIPFINKTSSDFCNSCSIAKSHKLPSSPSSTVYTAPLELVFF